ncbi:DUF924 family protein [Endozoicomonas sp.]|uniref:DUF924 family protein n=1 Tax=Endozoicomonas sp. TaxID=1892382 RepID=UPI002885DB7B|nr:DUF924 family protein [Endozoicomonas sp.]
MKESQVVLDFWFQELKPAQWYEKNPALDQQIIERFGEIHAMAVAGELFSWRTTPAGRVAELIVLDQFSRNMFRDSAKSFAFDGIALVLAQEAVSTGALDHLGEFQKNLILMPYMHSESRVVHEEAMGLRKRYGLDLAWEQKHKEIIDRFGRYPHRNEILDRVSTPEEVEFLKQPGSSF